MLPSESGLQSSLPSENLVLQMARRDIEVLFRTPWIIISRGLAFIIQLFVFATLISRLVSVSGFFQYYAVGSIISMVASISWSVASPRRLRSAESIAHAISQSGP